MLDVLLRNGTVVDGTGKPRFVADVGIEGDRISLVGRANGASAARTLDVTGKIVCPGIVDPHSHADLSVFRHDHVRLLEPLVRQGITTFIGGNCGMSLAPIGEKNRDKVKQYIEVFTDFDFEEDIRWRTFGEFLDTLESRGVLLNTAVLAPHGILRINAIGAEMRPATDTDIQEMAHDLEQALEEGAIGMSTGLQYIPGSQSETREIVALGATLKKYDGIFTSHLRSYSKTLNRAIDEVVEVARTHDIRAQISHLFWIPDFGAFGPMIRKGIRALARLSKRWVAPLPLEHDLAKHINHIMKARDQGVRMGVDVMPTTTGFTHALAFFPPWATVGSIAEVLARLADPQQRAKMRHGIEHGKMDWPHIEGDSWSLNIFRLMGWESVRIMAAATEKNRRYEGMSLVDIARERNKHPFDTICDLILEENGHLLVFESMAEPEDALTERSIFAGIRHPDVSISTDTILMGMGKPSHLFYGCYPKFLGRYVRQMGKLDLETAIRKTTSLPADHFQLKGRGKIEPGCFADILVFDYDRIATRATFQEPDRYPAGIEHVFINGVHVLEGDQFNGQLKPGKVLRRAG